MGSTNKVWREGKLEGTRTGGDKSVVCLLGVGVSWLINLSVFTCILIQTILVARPTFHVISGRKKKGGQETIADVLWND